NPRELRLKNRPRKRPNPRQRTLFSYPVPPKPGWPPSRKLERLPLKPPKRRPVAIGRLRSWLQRRWLGNLRPSNRGDPLLGVHVFVRRLPIADRTTSVQALPFILHQLDIAAFDTPTE